MKKFHRILALALLLAMCLVTLAIAKGKNEVLIDSSRNAAVKFTGQDSANGATGNFTVAGDVVKGLVSGTVDMKPGAAESGKIGNSSGSVYYNMTDVMELVGNLDTTLPPEASQELTKLEANVLSVLTTSKSNAGGDFKLSGKAKQVMPDVKLDGSLQTDAQKLDGKVTFDVTPPQLGEMPVKAFEFNLSEKAGNTTVMVGVTAEPGSPTAAQLKMMVGQNPDMIKQGIQAKLAQANIKVDSVTIGEYKEDKDGASTQLTIVMSGWREATKNLVGMFSGGKFDAEKMSAAVGSMLEAEFQTVVFKYDIKDKKSVSGELSGKINNVSKFMLGYYGLMAMVYESQLKDQGENGNPGERFLLAYQVVAMDEAKKALQAGIDANMAFDIKGKAEVKPTGDDKKSFDASGDFSADISNYKAYIEKAKAAGLPAAENSAFKLQAGLGDQNKLKGTVYAYADANFVNYYKTLVIATGKKAGAPADAIAEAEKVQFKGSSGNASITKDGVKGAFFLESSDLTALTKLAMQAGMGPQQIGNLVGFSLNGKTEGDKLNVQGSVNFTKFMEGKSADEVKAVMGADATVNDKAAPEAVKVVAVSKPEIAMPDSLKPVADDGKKLIASNPIAAITGGNAGGKGGNGLLYGLAALAAIGVIGVGMAAGKKKS